MHMYIVGSLMHYASICKYTGNENYRIGYNLVNSEGVKFDYIQFQQIYIERREPNYIQFEYIIFLEDKGEPKEIFRGGNFEPLDVPKLYKKEIINMCKQIERDVDSLRKRK